MEDPIITPFNGRLTRYYASVAAKKILNHNAVYDITRKHYYDRKKKKQFFMFRHADVVDCPSNRIDQKHIIQTSYPEKNNCYGYVIDAYSTEKIAAKQTSSNCYLVVILFKRESNYVKPVAKSSKHLQGSMCGILDVWSLDDVSGVIADMFIQNSDKPEKDYPSVDHEFIRSHPYKGPRDAICENELKSGIFISSLSVIDYEKDDSEFNRISVLNDSDYIEFYEFDIMDKECTFNTILKKSLFDPFLVTGNDKYNHKTRAGRDTKNRHGDTWYKIYFYVVEECLKKKAIEEEKQSRFPYFWEADAMPFIKEVEKKEELAPKSVLKIMRYLYLTLVLLVYNLGPTGYPKTCFELIRIWLLCLKYKINEGYFLPESLLDLIAVNKEGINRYLSIVDYESIFEMLVIGDGETEKAMTSYPVLQKKHKRDEEEEEEEEEDGDDLSIIASSNTESIERDRSATPDSEKEEEDEETSSSGPSSGSSSSGEEEEEEEKDKQPDDVISLDSEGDVIYASSVSSKYDDEEEEEEEENNGFGSID